MEAEERCQSPLVPSSFSSCCSTENEDDRKQILSDVKSLFHSLFGDIDQKLKFLLALYLSTHPPSNVAYSTSQEILNTKFIEKALRLMKFCTVTYGWQAAIFFALHPTKKYEIFQKPPSQAHRHDMNVSFFNFHCSLPASSILLSCWDSTDIFCPGYYLVIDHFSKSLVLALRGTLSMNDIITDLMGSEIAFSTGFAHCGIKKAADKILNAIEEQLNVLFMGFPGYSLEIVGHSLGGGTAALLSFLFNQKYPHYSVHAYCFGPPPVISKNLVPEMEKYATSFIVGNDVVPRLCYKKIRDLKDSILKTVDENEASVLGLMKSVVLRSSIEISSSNDNETDSQQPPVDVVELYLPGKLFHIYPQTGLSSSYSSSSSEKTKEKECITSYGLYESSIEKFTEIWLGNSIINDHMPNVYEKAIKSVLCRITSEIALVKSLRTKDEKKFFEELDSGQKALWITSSSHPKLQQALRSFESNNIPLALLTIDEYFTQSPTVDTNSSKKNGEAYLLQGASHLKLKNYQMANHCLNLAIASFTQLSLAPTVPHELVNSSSFLPSVCYQCNGLCMSVPMTSAMSCKNCLVCVHHHCKDQITVPCRSQLVPDPTTHFFHKIRILRNLICEECNTYLPRDCSYCLTCGVLVHQECSHTLKTACKGRNPIPWEEAYVLRAKSYFFLENYSDAIDDLNLVIEKSMTKKHMKKYKVARGLVLIRDGRLREAWTELSSIKLTKQYCWLKDLMNWLKRVLIEE